MLTSKHPKAKSCEVCERVFVPDRMGQIVCRPACAMQKVRQAKAQERSSIRQRKEAIKTIPELVKAAQVAFNAFIRARDAQQPCICCGRTETMVQAGHGWDCGHYRSTGSASHLRFNEDNAHRQLVLCNRYGAGRAVDYRAGLIARIGLARVEALEADNSPHKWTRDELIAIRDTYKKKLKDMKA